MLSALGGGALSPDPLTKGLTVDTTAASRSPDPRYRLALPCSPSLEALNSMFRPRLWQTQVRLFHSDRAVWMETVKYTTAPAMHEQITRYQPIRGCVCVAGYICMRYDITRYDTIQYSFTCAKTPTDTTDSVKALKAQHGEMLLDR